MKLLFFSISTAFRGRRDSYTPFCCPEPTLGHILASLLLSKFALSTPSCIGKAWQRKDIQHFCYLTLRLPFSKAPSSYQIWKTEYLSKQPPHLPIKSELPSVMVVDSFQSGISLVSDLLNCTLYVAIYAARGLWPLHEFCEMNFHSICDFDFEFVRLFFFFSCTRKRAEKLSSFLKWNLKYSVRLTTEVNGKI